MKLYFGSTPISNAEFLGSDVDDSESTSFDKDSGWKAVALLDKRMKKEVISDGEYATLKQNVNYVLKALFTNKCYVQYLHDRLRNCRRKRVKIVG